MRHSLITLLVLSSLALSYARANAAPPLVPPVVREFRGVWVATVENIDWPSKPGLPTAQQQAEMIAILDRAAQLNLNAVILQVRPACDALYDSKLEPWSEFLTGQMGQAPDPYYDPLAFAVDEAHKRGLELHAWINPYRASPASHKNPVSPNHISHTNPEIVRQYGKYQWLDPGEPATVEHSLAVVKDIVQRYDIDGIHYDDYFYPYQIKDEAGKLVDFPDEQSWQKYLQAGGKLARDDWRRDNVNTFVHRLYDEVKATKKWVKVGISPFGIWRPGSPPSIKGLDSYAELYADSKLWLNNGWLDYITPQLYWKITAPAQSFPVLLKWWTEQNTRGRNLWPGHNTGNVALLGKDRNWPFVEIVQQIQATRAQPGATGNVHFSMKVFMGASPELNDTLAKGIYAQPALVPASPWLDDTPPAQPKLDVRLNRITGASEARWTTGSPEQVWQWVVQILHGDAWSTEILPGSTLTRSWGADPEHPGQTLNNQVPDLVALSAVDRCGNQGAPVVVRLKWE